MKSALKTMNAIILANFSNAEPIVYRIHTEYRICCVTELDVFTCTSVIYVTYRIYNICKSMLTSWIKGFKHMYFSVIYILSLPIRDYYVQRLSWRNFNRIVISSSKSINDFALKLEKNIYWFYNYALNSFRPIKLVYMNHKSIRVLLPYP